MKQSWFLIYNHLSKLLLYKETQIKFLIFAYIFSNIGSKFANKQFLVYFWPFYCSAIIKLQNKLIKKKLKNDDHTLNLIQQLISSVFSLGLIASKTWWARCIYRISVASVMIVQSRMKRTDNLIYFNGRLELAHSLGLIIAFNLKVCLAVS